MKKPSDFDKIQEYGEFIPLELGGHICKIMQVTETQSKAGKDMIVIDLDIAEGSQKGYYAEQYKSDTRDNKKWGCKVYQLIQDYEGNTNRGLKTFITAVTKSNTGFKEVWGDAFANSFKGKLVGGVFGREEYINQNGDSRFATKCVNFRSIEAIKNGVEVPADKLLDRQANSSSNSNGFVEVEEDDSLPF